MKRKDRNTQSPSPAERLPSLDRSSRVLSYNPCYDLELDIFYTSFAVLEKWGCITLRKPQRMKATKCVSSEEHIGECGGEKKQFLPVILIYLANQHNPPDQGGLNFFSEDSDLSLQHWKTELDELGRFTALMHIKKKCYICHKTLNRNNAMLHLWTTSNHV